MSVVDCGGAEMDASSTCGIGVGKGAGWSMVQGGREGGAAVDRAWGIHLIRWFFATDAWNRAVF